MRATATAFLFGIAALPAPTAAQDPFWEPASGVSVCNEVCLADLPHIVPDGNGGAFIAWRDTRHSNPFVDPDVYAQKLTPGGLVAPGWPAEGLPVCKLPGSQDITDACSDGSGGVLIAWHDFRSDNVALGLDIYVQRILGDGSIAPGWPVNGALACGAPTSQFDPVVADDGTGGAYVAWDDYRDYAQLGYPRVFVQHLTATGQPAPGWPSDGLLVSPTPSVRPTLLSRGVEGLIVVWTGFAKEQIGGEDGESFAQHYLSDGSVAPGWPEGGLLIAVDRGHRGRPVADGAGGFYVGSASVANNADADYRIHRLRFDGTVAPSWPSEGVLICSAPDSRYALELAPDGMGGVFATWYDYRDRSFGSDIYVVRLLPDGTLAPGWTENGTVVRGPTGTDVRPGPAPDGLGGAYLVWETQDDFGSPGRLIRLTPQGQIAEGWPQDGVRLSPSSSQFDTAIAPDGMGGVIVGWSRIGVYGQRFAADGVVPTLPSLVSAEAEADRVVLSWYARDVSQAVVERRTSYSDWLELGPAEVEPASILRYEDRTVTPGERYAYRLGYWDGGVRAFTEETWVEVPSNLQFALHGFSPNPAVGTPTVSLTLPKADAARLEVYDLRGRLVVRRGLTSLGPGRHLIPLNTGARLASGVYLLRLTQGDSVAQIRGVVLD